MLGDQVKVVLFSCSEYEARNYGLSILFNYQPTFAHRRTPGRFLAGVLSDLHKWHMDDKLFMQDNRSKVAGKTVIHPGFRARLTNRNTALPESKGEELVSHTAFRRILKKWHLKLSNVRHPAHVSFSNGVTHDRLQCFIECIKTGEFMHVYNAIIVLKEILPYFPLATVSIVAQGSELSKTLETLIETEERDNLKILGRAYVSIPA